MCAVVLVLTGADIGRGYRVRSGRRGYSSSLAHTEILLVVYIYIFYITASPIYYTPPLKSISHYLVTI